MTSKRRGYCILKGYQKLVEPRGERNDIFTYIYVYVHIYSVIMTDNGKQCGVCMAPFPL